jgi:quercetin dioxygenase-like cupin family protein
VTLSGMELVTEPRDAVDLTAVPIHLGLGSRALAVEGFEWDGGVLAAYAAAVADDGAEGRMVMVFRDSRSWEAWERHPAGDEVVVCLSGRLTLIREVGGLHERVVLGPCEAAINPRGVWHTADVEEPVLFMTITPGVGTEHRPR